MLITIGPNSRVTENINVTSKKERKRDERRGARENRGRRREKPQTIQSHSIFEQGPADIICKTGLWFCVLFWSVTYMVQYSLV